MPYVKEQIKIQSKVDPSLTEVDEEFLKSIIRTLARKYSNGFILKKLDGSTNDQTKVSKLFLVILFN